MSLHTILELFLHPNSRQITPTYQAIFIKAGEEYLMEVDSYPQTLVLRRAAPYEVSLLDGVDNCYHSVVWVKNGKVCPHHPPLGFTS
jgi:hypothetical protein